MIFKTTCRFCGKKIKIKNPFKFKRFRIHGIFSCNECLPEDHCLRNGIEEPPWTEV